MKMRTCAALGTAALACALGATPAAAQSSAQGVYLGADVAIVSSTLEYRLVSGGSPVQEIYQTAHLRLRGGYRFTRMFAVEVQVLGESDDTEPDPFADSFKMTVGPIVGLYGRVNFPLGEQAGIYGLAGLASVETKYQGVSPSGPTDKDSVTKVSFGGGLEIKLSPNLRASADLMFYRYGGVDYPNYAFGSESPKQTVSALGFGLSYLF